MVIEIKIPIEKLGEDEEHHYLNVGGIFVVTNKRGKDGKTKN